MLTKIHVNQHNIKKNTKNGTNLPVLTVKDYKQNRLSDRAEIVDGNGTVVAVVVYSPDKPLPCGARCWIETELEVKVV